MDQQQVIQQMLSVPEIQNLTAFFPAEDPQFQAYLLSLYQAFGGNLQDIAIKGDIDAKTLQSYRQANLQPTIQVLQQAQFPVERIQQLRQLKQQTVTPMPTPMPQRPQVERWEQVMVPQQQQQYIPQQRAGYTPTQQGIPMNTQQAPIVQTRNSQDVVSPFVNRNVVQTQAFNNYNPGMGYYNNRHAGEDYAYTGGQGGELRTPIGGQVVANYYDPAYGNTVIVRGYNPQEFNQLSAQDRTDINKKEDYVRLSHLQNPAAWKPGEYVATGSAGLRMGTTGNSTGVHLDIESGLGNPFDFSKKRAFSQAYPQMQNLAQQGSGATGGGGVNSLKQSLVKMTTRYQPQAPVKLSTPQLKFSTPAAKPMLSTAVRTVAPVQYSMAKAASPIVQKAVQTYAPQVQKTVQKAVQTYAPQVQRAVQQKTQPIKNAVQSIGQKFTNFVTNLWR